MTEKYVKALDQILEANSQKVLSGSTDEEKAKGLNRLNMVSEIRVKTFTAQQTAYEKELALQIEQDKVDLEKEKLEFEKKKFELEKDKVDLEKDKVKIDAAKLKLDQEKIEADKKNSIVSWIQNGVICVLYVVGSCVIPMTIMKQDQKGEFWSRPAMNSTDRGPKFGFIPLPKIFGKK